ncbi:DDRGK domain-containing protein 1 [Macrobrachium rosenbergii]|uniref:DDRGK domain-containing protein 1 n=1 Tax=Macrobrachium rosenbergii TaxID=79674 RepID=UPI0034D64E6D
MDEIILYGGLILLVAAILGFLTFFKTKDAKVEARQERPRGPRPRAAAEDGIVAPNRVIANRQARARMRAAAARQERQEESDDEVADDASAVGEDIVLPEGKIGKKKMAKLQAKAEKRAAREAEERDREEKKQRDEKLAEERRKEEELEAEEEARREEQERKEREEREKRELEEYLAMKAQFEVEEEGFDENTDENAERNLLQEFVEHIKANKVVVLEDLAAKFQMKTQDCIKRVTDLQKEKTLTGVIDDRGKFIYVSQEELEGVAKFIRQRGRISITDLAEASHSLITLTPEACSS